MKIVLFRVSGFGFQGPSSEFREKSFEFRISGSGFRGSVFGRQGSGFEGPSPEFQEKSLKFRIPGSKEIRIPGFGFRVPNLVSVVWGVSG